MPPKPKRDHAQQRRGGAGDLRVIRQRQRRGRRGGDRDAADQDEQRDDHHHDRERGEARRAAARSPRGRTSRSRRAACRAMLHRSAVRPARKPNTMNPAELSPNASAYCCGDTRRCPAARRWRRRGRRTRPRWRSPVTSTAPTKVRSASSTRKSRPVWTSPPVVRRCREASPGSRAASRAGCRRRSRRGRRTVPRQSATVASCPPSEGSDDGGESGRAR